MVTPKRRGRRWLTALATVAVIAGTLVIGGTALAVHDETFQLDGDVDSSTQTNFGGSTQTVDWDAIFDTGGPNADAQPLAPLPAGFSEAGFSHDFGTAGNGSFLTSDMTTFATGSKDTLPISGWQCNFDNNVNSKIDIMNAYTVAYENPAGDEIVYFALERNTNTGDANVAFWFLQSAVSCTSAGGAEDFVGEHTDGDVLVVSEFSNGGNVSTINVYRWDGDDATGSLNPTPIGSGVDCRDPLLLPGDDSCAAANTTANGTNGTITTPWPTANFKDKVGHSLRTSEFFEGGINLTDLNLAGKCFNTFIADTRSSTSLTATLFDFAAVPLGSCTSETVTTPKEADGTTTLTTIQIPADGTLEVTDSALITVNGVDSFTATVSFSLCGPFATGTTTTCDSGGVPIGSAKPVTSTPSTVVSDAATITSVGRYCWRAEFSGDAAVGVPPSSDHSSGECFVVTPRTPTLTTLAGAGPVDFGNPVTDTAQLGNTANQKGSDGPAGSTDGSINPTIGGSLAQGTITFTLYKDDACTVLATGTGQNPQTVDVNGDGTYGPVSFTPDAPGTYHWVANYGGDPDNTNASAPSACLDEDEDVVVRQIPTTIKTQQSWFPNDTAEIGATIGNLGAGGSVVFSLYASSDCSTAVLYTETESITGGAPTETVSTDNTTFNIATLFADPADTTVSYSWKVVYTPAAGDTAHTGIQSSCHAEHFSITYTNDNGPGSDLP